MTQIGLHLHSRKQDGSKLWSTCAYDFATNESLSIYARVTGLPTGVSDRAAFTRLHPMTPLCEISINESCQFLGDSKHATARRPFNASRSVCLGTLFVQIS